MALVEFRQPAAKFSGRTGVDSDGQVYYTLEGRGIARTLVIPTNPRSTQQQTIRSLQTSLAVQYSGLTRAQADAWNDFGKNMTSTDRLGRKYAYRGIQAFLAVNVHRVLAGQAALEDPPAHVATPAPIQIVSANASAGNDFTLVVQHQVAAAAGIWRIRLTPALRSQVVLASPGALRAATTAFPDSYVATAASPQALVFTSRYSYTAGQTLGVEVLGLSTEYVPGQVLFNRHVTLT